MKAVILGITMLGRDLFMIIEGTSSGTTGTRKNHPQVGPDNNRAGRRVQLYAPIGHPGGVLEATRYDFYKGLEVLNSTIRQHE